LIAEEQRDIRVYFIALATDYDGTIAHDGIVDRATCEALDAFKKTGRRLILVTGRELPDLKRIFPHLSLFERVVVENGALLHEPATDAERTIATPPPEALIQALKDRDVPISIGRSIVATWEPHENTVLECIRDLGLEMQIIFNKGAVMVLPAGVNKATGLSAALAELEISAHNVVGIGDAENDHAFLKACGCSVAVANALPMLKESADLVTRGARGAGVIELMERLVTKDAKIVRPHRHGIVVGKNARGDEVLLESHDGSVLIAGQSGIGKSTIATALTERMAEKQFQFCVLDPEGDYGDLENSVSVGDAKTPPSPEEGLVLLRRVAANVVVNTLALDLNDRPPFFANLLPELCALRANTGRPHWLIFDEAHHLLPAKRENISYALPKDLPAAIFITVHPEEVALDALSTVDTVLALGPDAADVIRKFCKAVGIDAPGAESPKDDEILMWRRSDGDRAHAIIPYKPKQSRKRHTRKYAEGDLGPDKSFYFRGPDDALNLRANNLTIFSQIAEGVDDRTWEHHLRAGDYSQWFREKIRDDELAQNAAKVEEDRSLSPGESRTRIIEAITRRYAT
jgi:hydroxymethylpyrimidine pyrophosphatase-like HAD family hydrolase